MLADIIILTIVGILFVLCIRKQVVDYRNGVPSCGLNCGGCSGGCGGCSADQCSACQAQGKQKRFRKKKK